MSHPVTYFQQAHLDEAIKALGVQLRREPADAQARTFLFELLCFAGQFDRAAKQLDVLAQQSDDAGLAVTVLQGLLRAHARREAVFAADAAKPACATIVAAPTNGPRAILNGYGTSTCTDEDERVGAALEVYASGEYTRVALEDLEQVTAKAPASLRDLLWFPVQLRYRTGEITAAHLPAMAPLSWQHTDDEVRSGRASILEHDAHGNSVPLGTKLLVCDERYVPLVDLRSLHVHAAAEAPGSAAGQGREP